MMLNIVKANARITELETDNKNLLTKVQEAETAFKNLQTMSKDMTEKQAEHETALATMENKCKEALATMKDSYQTAVSKIKADYEKQISDLNTKVTATAKSSEAKALTIVSQAGLPPDTLPATTNEDTTQILQQMKGMSPVQLSEFFMKNQKAIFAALKAKQAKKE